MLIQSLRLLCWVLSSPSLAVRENDSARILYALLHGHRPDNDVILTFVVRIGHDLGIIAYDVRYRGPSCWQYTLAVDLVWFIYLQLNPFSQQTNTRWPRDPARHLSDLAASAWGV